MAKATRNSSSKSNSNKKSNNYESNKHSFVSEQPLLQIVAFLALLFIFVSEAFIRADIIALDSHTDIKNNVKNNANVESSIDTDRKHINKIMTWNQTLANEVPFIAIETKSKSKTKAEPSPSSLAGPFHLSYDKDTSILKLIHHSNNHRVVDRIHADDIIGAKIEFCLGIGEGSAAELENVDDRNEKSQKAMEQVESIEKDMLKEHLISSEAADDADVGGTVCHPDNADGATSMASTSSSAAYLNIYAYPRARPRRGILGQVKDCISSSPDNDNEDDATQVEQLGPRYQHHRRYKLAPMEDFAQARELLQHIRHVAGIEHVHANANARYLVIVNPMSGTKKGRQLYQSTVRHMLTESGVHHELLVTDHAGHAKERMSIDETIRMSQNDNDDEGMVQDDSEHKDSKDDISKYNGVITVGGDGTLSEIMQGLKEREDYDELLEEKLTFGVLGGGTSNGLASTLLYARKVRFLYFELN
jgi:hypothetical protein